MNTILKDITEGRINLDRGDGHAINYSSGDRDNKGHYEKLCAVTSRGGDLGKSNAIVLGSGAGYGAFYLAMNGVGKVVGEELDQRSVEVANFLRNYFGYENVQETFMNQGLRRAMDVAINNAKVGFSKPMKNVSFRLRNVTQSYEDDKSQQIIICDFIHSPDFIGEESMGDLMYRVDELSRSGTILSYRGGSNVHMVKRLGFGAVNGNSEIFRKF